VAVVAVVGVVVSRRQSALRVSEQHRDVESLSLVVEQL